MMDKKNTVEVIINNKIYTLCGFESDEYLHKIATYINGKYAEFRSKDEFANLNNEMKSILLEINVADDYFKAQKQCDEYLSEIEIKNKELFELKHEIISFQTKQDNLHKEQEELKDELETTRKNVIRLEAEIAEYNKQSGRNKK